MQTTLIILKPDAVQRGLSGRIIARFEDKGLQIVGAKMLHMSKDLAEKHYAVHKSKPFYPPLIRFITSSPVMVLAVYGKEAIGVVRKLVGATAGRKAEPGTIRGDFSTSVTFNLIHASDGVETAKQELALFFKPDEICPYERVVDHWIYDTSGGSPD